MVVPKGRSGGIKSRKLVKVPFKGKQVMETGTNLPVFFR